ncbi:MAG TPA: GNAT family N-acetyltransferase [Caulobacterales bacterium]|nr:GNAT family N-acetyltransferase [Caulobacterales bacterium]
MIEGSKIALGPVQAEDSEILFNWINDPQIVHLHGPFRPVDSESHRKWIERLPSDPSTIVFAIREKSTKRLIGLVQLVGVHNVHRSAEMRIRIGEATDRGKGWGAEAVELCCRFAFGDMGLARVFLHVFADNALAIGAYEKSGFSYEGLMRRAAFIGGTWKDVVVMARMAPEPSNAEFTEAGFASLLDALIASGYRFASYGDTATDKHVIWRHDVDFSMHRGAKLAAIEAARGVRVTYFVNPRSTFYNLLEADVAAKARAIAGLGHEIGLHFDAPAPDGGTWTATTLEAALTKEKMLIEAIVERPVRVVSWHNPDQSNLLSFEGDMIAGLHNAYSARLKRDYVYCSDSNGYWRFTPMAEVIAAGHPRLHLLTHPAWWTPTPLSPSARVDRAILGRARAVRRDYDGQLQAAGRKNIDG